MMASIVEAPDLGTRLDGPLDGWRVRHWGRGRVLSIIDRVDSERLLVAFVGRD